MHGPILAHFLPRCRQRTLHAVLSACLAWAALFGAIGPVEKTQAQNPAELSAVYGRGVHAFFANQSGQAEMLFTQVIQTGSTDPRVFYFRAVARQRMGRQYEAESDMRMGAAYEARNPGSMRSISRALERVQGHARRKLEKFRREARLHRVQQHRHQSHARYEQLQRRETQVLRNAVEVPLEQLLNPPTNRSVPVLAPAEVSSPEGPPLIPGPVPEEPVDLEADPFGSPSVPGEPVEDFLEQPAEPTPAEPPVAEPTESDPFGLESTPPDSEPPVEESAEVEPPAVKDLETDLFAPEDSPAEDAFEETEEAPAATLPEPAAVEIPASSEPSALAPSDRVKSDKLLGILGRVVGQAMPWSNIQIPGFTPPRAPAAGFPAAEAPADAFEFGPVDEPTDGETEGTPFEFTEMPPESSAADAAEAESFAAEEEPQPAEPETTELESSEPEESTDTESTDSEEDPFDEDPFGGF